MSVRRPAPRRVFLALLGLSLILALAACGDGSSGGSTAVEINAPGLRFDKEELVIAAGTDVEVTMTNVAGIHNFAVYASQEEAEAKAEAIAATEVCRTGCIATLTLNLPPGEYFFRCDIHPSRMTGTLIAR